MKEPVLIVMAAGMGSRFGSLKQVAPIDAEGCAIIDYSLYDARRAGFKKVIFIIKKAIEEAFRSTVGKRAEKVMDVEYVYQELDRLPEGFSVPEGREKPWGTGHAVLCCRDLVDGPFAVVNADDFYGYNAFRELYAFLSGDRADGDFAMVGFLLRNTLSDSGTVSRGVCSVTEEGHLKDITERTKIRREGSGGAYTENGTDWVPLPGDTTVSMNFWGFTPRMMEALNEGFSRFLQENLPANPLKCEYFLPFVADSLLKEGKARVTVLHSPDAWHGLTYAEDLADLQSALDVLRKDGRYPEKLYQG